MQRPNATYIPAILTHEFYSSIPEGKGISTVSDYVSLVTYNFRTTGEKGKARCEQFSLLAQLLTRHLSQDLKPEVEQGKIHPKWLEIQEVLKGFDLGETLGCKQ
ncbi:hypothetical protein [Thiothrix nivea]|uniref:hypothetical protein n=1 Tax=Thiothrix nivea TaxID=1031 RepID=UPI0012B69DE6|nr:hypothetical protein [Thiothrix nivea]